MKKSSTHQRCGAFTLTEIAIVVGIIGVMVGGIWTAASYVREQNRIARAIKDIQYIVAKTGALMSNNSGGLNFGCPGACEGVTPPCTGSPAPSQTASTAAAAAAGIFPTDMLTYNSYGCVSGECPSVVQFPWGSVPPGNKYGTGAALFDTETVNECSGGIHTLFEIRLGPVPADACTKIIMSNLQNWVNEGLYQIWTSPITGNNCTAFFAITPSNYTTIAADAGCPESKGVNFPNVATLCQNSSTTNPLSQLSFLFEWPPEN